MSCYSFGLLAGKDKVILYENVITSTLQQHTLTGRSTPRTTACSLACVSNTPQQGVPWITTVGGCLSKCCSSSVTNLAFGWVIQSTTVYNCEKNTCMYCVAGYHSTKDKINIIPIHMHAKTEIYITLI